MHYNPPSTAFQSTFYFDQRVLPPTVIIDGADMPKQCDEQVDKDFENIDYND